jgi:hypothetical protein
VLGQLPVADRLESGQCECDRPGLHAESHSDRYCDSYGYRNSNGDGYSNGDRYGNSHANGNSYGPAEAITNAQAASDGAAEAVSPGANSND